jgi:hypothetical protein
VTLSQTREEKLAQSARLLYLYAMQEPTNAQNKTEMLMAVWLFIRTFEQKAWGLSAKQCRRPIKDDGIN